MATEKKGKKKQTKSSLYRLEGESVLRTRKFCPKCGSGVFLASHQNRITCGKCGFTEMKNR